MRKFKLLLSLVVCMVLVAIAANTTTKAATPETPKILFNNCTFSFTKEYIKECAKDRKATAAGIEQMAAFECFEGEAPYRIYKFSPEVEGIYEFAMHDLGMAVIFDSNVNQILQISNSNYLSDNSVTMELSESTYYVIVFYKDMVGSLLAVRNTAADEGGNSKFSAAYRDFNNLYMLSETEFDVDYIKFKAPKSGTFKFEGPDINIEIVGLKEIDFQTYKIKKGRTYTLRVRNCTCLTGLLEVNTTKIK